MPRAPGPGSDGQLHQLPRKSHSQDQQPRRPPAPLQEPKADRTHCPTVCPRASRRAHHRMRLARVPCHPIEAFDSEPSRYGFCDSEPSRARRAGWECCTAVPAAGGLPEDRGRCYSGPIRLVTGSRRCLCCFTCFGGRSCPRGDDGRAAGPAHGRAPGRWRCRTKEEGRRVPPTARIAEFPMKAADQARPVGGPTSWRCCRGCRRMPPSGRSRGRGSTRSGIRLPNASGSRRPS